MNLKPYPITMLEGKLHILRDDVNSREKDVKDALARLETAKEAVADIEIALDVLHRYFAKLRDGGEAE